MMTNRILVVALLLAVLPYASAACFATPAGTSSANFCYDLLAGQHINIGSVCLTTTGTDLHVTYQVTVSGWYLQQTHVWVGTSLDTMPQTRQGNPRIGHFPYSNNHAAGTTSFTISAPLSSVGFNGCPSPDVTALVAAHAAVAKTDGSGNVIQTETAWSKGDLFVQRGMWGTYGTFTLTCQCSPTEPPAPSGTCETAFAHSAQGLSTCFLYIDANADGVYDFNRWGWTNGPIQAGDQGILDMWAGAGQCNLAKGENVGTLTYTYSPPNLYVTYSIPATSEWTWKQTHVHAGSEILARNNGVFTVAPGQYDHIHGDLPDGTKTDTYTITGLSGPIYLVAHASTCN